MGAECYHVCFLRSPGPALLSPSHKEDICDRCKLAGYSAEKAPEQYESLFRAARVLFDENVTDEYVVIPTLAFAASSWEVPELGSVRDKFAEVHNRFMEAGNGTEAWRTEEWLQLDARFFFNRYAILQPLDIKQGVLIVRSAPIDALYHENEEMDLVEQVEVAVHRLSVTSDELADFYERQLVRRGIYYEEGRGDICLRESPRSTTIRIIARSEFDTGSPILGGEPGEWYQGPFPRAQKRWATYTTI